MKQKQRILFDQLSAPVSENSENNPNVWALRILIVLVFVNVQGGAREGGQKIYVQNRITNNGKEIWEWLQNGAYFFICGDKQYMAKDVHKALINIAEKHGKMQKEEAEHYINQTLMKEEHRYLRDVY